MTVSTWTPTTEATTTATPDVVAGDPNFTITSVVVRDTAMDVTVTAYGGRSFNDNTIARMRFQCTKGVDFTTLAADKVVLVTTDYVGTNSTAMVTLSGLTASTLYRIRARREVP
jgi:hypothetical protein